MNLKKTAAIFTLFGVVWLSAGCSVDSTESIPLPESREQVEVRNTLPPMVETTTPTTETDYSDSECAGIDVEDTSEYTPEDWDAWCKGYMSVSDIWDGLDQPGRDELCADFWTVPDSQLLQESMFEWGMTRDQGIGFIDFLWLNC